MNSPAMVITSPLKFNLSFALALVGLACLLSVWMTQTLHAWPFLLPWWGLLWAVTALTIWLYCPARIQRLKWSQGQWSLKMQGQWCSASLIHSRFSLSLLVLHFRLEAGGRQVLIVTPDLLPSDQRRLLRILAKFNALE